MAANSAQSASSQQPQGTPPGAFQVLPSRGKFYVVVKKEEQGASGQYKSGPYSQEQAQKIAADLNAKYPGGLDDYFRHVSEEMTAHFKRVDEIFQNAFGKSGDFFSRLDELFPEVRAATPAGGTPAAAASEPPVQGQTTDPFAPVTPKPKRTWGNLFGLIK